MPEKSNTVWEKKQYATANTLSKAMTDDKLQLEIIIGPIKTAKIKTRFAKSFLVQNSLLDFLLVRNPKTFFGLLN